MGGMNPRDEVHHGWRHVHGGGLRKEGIEAQEVIVNDGELNITASDDGINAAGGRAFRRDRRGGCGDQCEQDCLIRSTAAW